MNCNFELLNRVVTSDARDYIELLEDDSINSIVTSPPYFNQRQYFDENVEIGAIGTLEQYTQDLTEIFVACKPKLRDDATLWIVIGDAYAGSGKGAWINRETKPNRTKENYNADPRTKQGKPVVPDGMKPKDLMGMGWKLAFALRDAGFYLRSDIIWHIPNAKPGSYKDRPVTEHQYLFMLSKSRHYFYNYEKAVEPTSDGTGTRVLRDVWEFNSAGDVRLTDGTQVKHTAKYPPELAQRCIQLSCPQDGVVLDPFMGSGSTGVAAIREGISFLGCDINPQFVDWANKRIEEERQSYSFAIDGVTN